MKRIVCFLAAFLGIAVATSAQRGEMSKMSSFVRRIVTEQVKDRRADGKKTATYRDSKASLCAFARIEGDMDSTLTANGCKLLAHWGDLCIADIPVGNIAKLSGATAVKRIEAQRGTRLHMDSMAVNINASPIYKGVDLPQAYTGNGVVMGIMDVGFDFTHPNFYSEDGTEFRIKSVWDQLSADTLNSSLYVGAEYAGESDILACKHSRDGLIQTHGTLTLGIAAGGGAGSKYRGIAYGSDICLVNNAVSDDMELISDEDQYKYTYATDALGFKYIFDYAEQQQKPCVISFSEGSTQDLRGDDALYYEALGKMVGQGRIIVSSAGNIGHIKNYIIKERGRDSAGSFIKLWGSNPLYFTLAGDNDFDLRIVVYGSNADTLTIHTSDVVTAEDSVLTVNATLNGNEYEVTLSAFQSCYDSGKTAYDVTMKGPTHMGMYIPMSVEMIGSEAECEFYRINGELTANDVNPSLCDGDNSHGVYSPSSSPDVICVGATTYRDRYTNVHGGTVVSDWGEYGQRATFSSEGPTFDGRTKPEVLAPGVNILTSANSFYLDGHSDEMETVVDTFTYNNRRYDWMACTGTSMSSPAVGGVIALWLQADPTLTPEDIIGIFKRTCTTYDDMTSIPDNKYGYGQIDAYRGLLDILHINKLEYIEQQQPAGVHFSISGKTLHISTDKSVATNLSLSVYTVGGVLVSRDTLPFGNDNWHIDMGNCSDGVYIINIKSSDKAVRGSTLIRI